MGQVLYLLRVARQTVWEHSHETETEMASKTINVQVRKDNLESSLRGVARTLRSNADLIDEFLNTLSTTGEEDLTYGLLGQHVTTLMMKMLNTSNIVGAVETSIYNAHCLDAMKEV